MYVSDVHGTAPFTRRQTQCKKYGLSAKVDQRLRIIIPCVYMT